MYMSVFALETANSIFSLYFATMALQAHSYLTSSTHRYIVCIESYVLDTHTVTLRSPRMKHSRTNAMIIVYEKAIFSVYYNKSY